MSFYKFSKIYLFSFFVCDNLGKVLLEGRVDEPNVF